MAVTSTGATETGGGAASPPPSLFQDIISSIFTPGTNTGLIQAMNYSFYALFVTLLGMLWLTSGNLHVCALLALSVGLFISVKWFLLAIKDVEELHRIERVKKEELEALEKKTEGGEVGEEGADVTPMEGKSKSE